MSGLKLVHDDHFLLGQLALASLGSHDFEGSLSAINEVICSCPSEHEYYEFRARIKFELYDYSGASTDCDSALNLVLILLRHSTLEVNVV